MTARGYRPYNPCGSKLRSILFREHYFYRKAKMSKLEVKGKYPCLLLDTFFFFLGIQAESPTRQAPSNNCPQIMVCSCVISSKCVLLQIIFYSCVIVTTLEWKWQIASLSFKFGGSSKYENKLGDRMIKQLLNSVITKYRNLSVSRKSIICRSRRLNDILTTDKSRYFVQPFPIIVDYEGLDRDNSMNVNTYDYFRRIFEQ